MPRPAATKAKRMRRRWLSVLGGLVGLAGLAWILAGLDYGRLRTIVAEAEPGFLLLVPLAIAAEQLVRAWKWGRLVDPLRRIPTLRLFGAIMAGYLANLLVPLGMSPLVRSWLVAKLEGLTMTAVLATVAVDRLIDGIVFVGIVALVVLFAAFPDQGGEIRLGLALGGAGSLLVFVLLVFALRRHRRQVAQGGGWLMRLADRLPARLVGRGQALLVSFAEGVVWPPEPRRQIAIVAASVVIKLLAASHFLWAGLAFGVLLRPFEYLFLLAFLGFLIILTHVARIPGGFIVGSVFALGLLGVGDELALAMVMVLITANIAVIGVIGAFTLWRHGIILAEVRIRGSHGREPRNPAFAGFVRSLCRLNRAERDRRTDTSSGPPGPR